MEAIIQNRNSHPLENHTRSLLCIAFTWWSVIFQQKYVFLKELTFAALFRKQLHENFCSYLLFIWQVKKPTLPVENPSPQKARGLEFACMGASSWHTGVDSGLCCPRLSASVLYTVWLLWVRNWTWKDDFILITSKWPCVPGGADVPGGDCPACAIKPDVIMPYVMFPRHGSLFWKLSLPGCGLVLSVCPVLCRCCRGIVRQSWLAVLESKIRSFECPALGAAPWLSQGLP